MKAILTVFLLSVWSARDGDYYKQTISLQCPVLQELLAGCLVLFAHGAKDGQLFFLLDLRIVAEEFR